MNSIIIHATLKEESVEHYAMVSEILCHFSCGSLKVLSKESTGLSLVAFWNLNWGAFHHKSFISYETRFLKAFFKIATQVSKSKSLTPAPPQAPIPHLTRVLYS